MQSSVMVLLIDPTVMQKIFPSWHNDVVTTLSERRG